MINTNKLILHPTALSQWHALVTEACYTSNINIDEELESYLVFLLMRFINSPEILQSIIATKFLDSTFENGQCKVQALKDVGDLCLLFAGLFPGNAKRRRVKISYYINIGQTAYLVLSEQQQTQLASLFAALHERFISLMDVLQTIRDLSSKHMTLDLLQAEELWREANSQCALETLRTYFPNSCIISPQNIKH